MTRPKLDDEVGRESYRRELKALYRPWRWVGLALTVAGVLLMFVRGGRFDRDSILVIAVGWVILVGVIVARTRYHRRRMAEPPEAL